MLNGDKFPLLYRLELHEGLPYDYFPNIKERGLLEVRVTSVLAHSLRVDFFISLNSCVPPITFLMTRTKFLSMIISNPRRVHAASLEGFDDDKPMPEPEDNALMEVDGNYALFDEEG